MQSDLLFESSSKFNLEKRSSSLVRMLINKASHHTLIYPEEPFLFIKSVATDKKEKKEFQCSGGYVKLMFKSNSKKLCVREVLDLLNVLGMNIKEEDFTDWIWD